MTSIKPVCACSSSDVIYTMVRLSPLYRSAMALDPFEQTHTHITGRDVGCICVCVCEWGG